MIKVPDLENDPCGEQINFVRDPVFPYTFPQEYSDVKHLGHGRFGRHNQIADMYFSANSPIGRAALMIRFGEDEDQYYLCASDDVANWNVPEVKPAFEMAYACAKRRGYIP